MSSAIPKDIKASLYIDGKPAEASLKNVEQVTRNLEKELRGLVIGTDAWNAKMKEVANNKKYLKEIKAEINGVGGAFGRLKAELGTLGSMALGYLGFQFVSDQFNQMISSNAKLSDSLADVRKTTGLSEEGVIGLSKELKKIDTRTSTQELLNLATVAGKLGVSGKDDVLGFVRAADQISVALGKDLGDTEQAVNDLGKLTDLFKIKDEFGLESALIKTGSAVNALGAAGTANESYIVEFTKRLGTIAPAANISIENVLGLAATMDELGQPAEAASTALAQFVVGMGKNLPTFAKVAGLSVKDFSAVLRRDGNEALTLVLEKIKATGGGVEELAAKMGLIGEDGARATAALGALSNNLDKLRARQAMSNDEFAKGTSLTNEFNIKNENFAATLDKIGKWFYGMATSKVITDTLTSAANGFARLVGISKSHSEELDVEQTKLYAMRIELDSTNTSSQRRKEILEALKTTYPEYLKYLDTDTAKNADLLPILEKINDQYVIRIAYQKRMEALDETVKAEAESMNDVYDNNQKLILQLGKIQRAIAEDGIKFTIQGRTEQEKATFIYKNLTKAINEQAITNRALNQVQASGKYETLIAGMTNYGNSVKSATESLEKNKGERLKLEADAKNFKNSFTFKDKDIKGSEQMQMHADQLFHSIKKMDIASKGYKTTLAQIQKLNVIVAMQRKAEEMQGKLNDKGVDKNKLKNEIKSLNDSIAIKKKEFDQIGVTPVKASGGNAPLGFGNKNETKTKGQNPAEKEKQEAEKLRDDLKKIGDDIYKNSLSKWTKEIADVETKYNELRKRANGNKADLAEIDRLQAAEQKTIEAKITAESEKNAEESAKEIIEIRAKIFEATATEYEIEYMRTLKHYDDLIKAAEKHGEDTTKLKEKQLLALMAIDDKKAGKKTPEQIAADNKALKEEETEFYINSAQQVSDTVGTILSNKARAESDRRLSALQKERDTELSNKNLTEEEKANINAKFDAKVKEEKRRAWQAEQKAAIAQALINGALAATKVLAQTGVLSPFALPAIAIATLANIAVISSQEPPQYASGGMTDEDPAGYVSNATIFNKSASGRRFVAGEKGREWIAPNWMLNNPATANIIGTLEVARKEKRMFANGGFNNTEASPSSANNGSPNYERLESLIYQFISAQGETNKKPVVLDYRGLEEYRDNIEKARIRQTG